MTDLSETKPLKPAVVLDLDGTLSHAEPALRFRRIRGRTSDSRLDDENLRLLSEISRTAPVFPATGRSASTVSDFQTAFADAGVRIGGWILEHGALIPGFPEWTRKLLRNMDLNAVREQMIRLIQNYDFPIDAHRYRKDHEAILLLSGNGAVLAEHFIDRASKILGSRFRTIAGKRKIALIPSGADKNAAFQFAFGKTYEITCAAGDQPDDLPLLKHARFAFAPASAHPTVLKYVKRRGGTISSETGHKGTRQLLEAIRNRLRRRNRNHFVPGPRLPIEETVYFRPSKASYLDRLFDKTVSPESVPSSADFRRWTRMLNRGRGRIIEVRMRDWGGEAKPLSALVHAVADVLPYSRWKLVFRPERLGVENLRTYASISGRMEELSQMPDGKPRFAAPGVPGSPEIAGDSDLTLLMYDYPEDLHPFYERVITRLATRHPQKARTWFVNPLYLKIAGAERLMRGRGLPKSRPTESSTMMAANLIGPRDIAVAFKGFQELRKRGAVQRLIAAPRVVTNPERNRRLMDSAKEIGEKPELQTQTRQDALPRVLIVDTYGDLPRLYSGCAVTYLGGGFNSRKRGFDPVESLCSGVPVLTGPYCDYNRVSVAGLSPTGWVTVLPDPETAVADFVKTAEKLCRRKPSAFRFEDFMTDRRQDPLRTAGELMADLAGETGEGYLLRENRCFPQDALRISDLAERDAGLTTDNH